ncbi:MAG: hypothetical protein COA85_02015 [Robiginitomaculum sp.]|nr:MAG: hypothetical protein COA85_02015 [Robiginitomaculum sp.]
MNRFIFIGAVSSLLVLSGFLGWQQAGTQSFTMRSNQADWKTPPAIGGGKEKIALLRQKIFQSGYFKNEMEIKDNEESQIVEADSPMAAAEKKYGKFPHIISISRIDGKDTAQLRQYENKILTVRVGDILQSGWSIKQIFSDRLVAQAGPESFSFAVIEHKNKKAREASDE